jgi:flavin-dependent dehydrogenase
VTIRRGVGIAELATGAADRRGVVHVCGVVTESGERIPADLVVDATGRNTQLAARLAALGAPPPTEAQQEFGGTYYSRFYRSRSGSLPESVSDEQFIQGQSIGLFAFTGDNATYCLSVYGLSDDTPLRATRRPEVFEAIVRAFPDREHWLNGEPISEITAFAARSDCTREFRDRRRAHRHRHRRVG